MPPTPLERWRTRAWRAFALACVLLVIFHFCWGWYADRAISRWKADAHKRGQPLSLDELLVPDPSDTSVAFGQHTQAAMLLSTTARSPTATVDASFYEGYCTGRMSRPTSDLTVWKLPSGVPFPPAWMAAAEASERANVRVFELARQAARAGNAPGRQVTLDSDTRWAEPEASRSYALTLRDSAELNYIRGDHLLAIERLLDLMHAARAFRQGPWTGVQIDSDKFTQFAADSALMMAPSLAASRRPSAPLRDPIRMLIAALLQPDPWNPRAVSSSLAGYLLYADCVIDKDRRTIQRYHVTTPDLAGSRILRPAFQTMELRMARRYDRFAPALALTNRPALLAFPYQHCSEFPNSDDTIGWLRDCLEMHLEIVAQRRAAAISLAANLYVADHGHWPDRLQQLVPDYLPDLPDDPLMPAGHPMTYLLLKLNGFPAGERPLVGFGITPVVLTNGVPVDLPARPAPLLPRNYPDTPSDHTWYDLSRPALKSP